MVSGLPASGKTTVARRLALALGLPVYDKDVILEALFDTMGSVDLNSRQRLSRASDRVLAMLVEQSRGAVITSFWCHPTDEGISGTPCDWLRRLSRSLVEVYCSCPPDIAVQRFLHRSRHPGHHDAARTEQMLRAQFRQAAAQGPLALGSVIVVDTSGEREIELPIERIRRALRRADASP